MPAKGKPRETPVRQDAADLLYLLGFQQAELDPLFALCVRVATEYVLNQTNQREIPVGLYMATAYRIVGEYFNTKLQSGGITKEQMGATTDAAVKQLKQGDTTISFAIGDEITVEQRFGRLVDSFLRAGHGQYASHRKLRW